MAIDRNDYPGIPDDFPIEAQASALAGTQPKLSLVVEGGRYFAPGTSPQEVREDFEEMQDLVNQVCAYCNDRTWPSSQALDEMLERESQIMQLHYGIRARHVTWIVTKVRLRLQEAGLIAGEGRTDPAS